MSEGAHKENAAELSPVRRIARKILHHKLFAAAEFLGGAGLAVAGLGTPVTGAGIALTVDAFIRLVHYRTEYSGVGVIGILRGIKSIYAKT